MYVCIDMRSFFASVECALRGLNSLTTPLAVVDASRGDGALIMAATPALKAYGVPSRCRLFEVPKDIFFIKAKPRMQYYIQYAEKIHNIFLSFFSSEDVLVYSIDESFIRVDEYLPYYGNSLKKLAVEIMRKIHRELGIYCTCGAGDNMYLSKISLDILAKKNGGYFYLSEKSFQSILWHHQPITDFWMIGPGTEAHLKRLHMKTMEDIARANPYLLKQEFGILGAEMQAHAWGKDPTQLSEVKEYVPANHSLSKSQILFEDYKKEDAILPLLEMTYLLCLAMCDGDMDAKGMSFYVGYSKDIAAGTGKSITFDYRVRSFSIVSGIVKDLYEKNVLDLPIRSVAICFSEVRKIESRQLSLFYQENSRYIQLCKCINEVHERYGKNAVFPGSALMGKSTLRYRNGCIGGHNGK